MNNQPKFKKGDRVQMCEMHQLRGLTGTVIKIQTEGSITVKLSDERIITFYDFEIEPYSPAPDMLAIPDDHVFTESNNQQ